MDEYIKKSYAVDAVLDVYYDTPDIDLSGEKFEDAILKIQAADVASVRHGRWVHEHISEGYAWVICSECEAVIHKILINKRLNYCPNCGAKMDGGVDDG